MTLPLLTAAHRLDEVVPAAAVYAPRQWNATNPWLSSDPHLQAAPTGNMLGLGGSTECLVHRACVGPASYELYDLAGMPDPAPHIGYAGSDEAEEQVFRLAQYGRPLLTDYRPPPDFWDRGLWLNRPELIAYLNDKANLDALAPPAAFPERFFVPHCELRQLADRAPTLPAVLKASTEEGNGGGLDVRICRTAAEWSDAVSFFETQAAHLRGLVVERFEAFTATWCALVGITDEGWSHWGSSQQVCSGDGKYGGNWKGRGFEMPEAALELVAHVADQGQRRGFRGVAGMDLGRTEDGRLLVFDLNFRLNGCTPQVVFHDAACERVGAVVSRSRRFRFSRPLAEVVPQLRPLLEQGRLVPVSAFDAALDPAKGGVSSVSTLLVGASRDEVRQLEQQLEALA
jgi:hypothetical protein